MWQINVTMEEFSEISRLSERCRSRDMWDEYEWLAGLTSMGLYPLPEGVQHPFNIVVQPIVTERFTKCLADRAIPIDEFLGDTSPNVNHIEIGQRIVSKRKSLYIERERLATMLGITEPDLFRIEEGEKILSITKAQTLATILETTVHWLLTGKEK